MKDHHILYFIQLFEGDLTYEDCWFNINPYFEFLYEEQMTAVGSERLIIFTVTLK